jgi:hypothetical protein
VNPKTRLALLGTLLLIFLATTGSGYLFLIERNQLALQNQSLAQQTHRAKLENTTLRSDVDTLRGNLRAKQAEYHFLQGEHTSLLQDREILGIQAEGLRQSNQLLNQRLDEMKLNMENVLAEKTLLIRRITRLETREMVELPKIVVRGSSAEGETQANEQALFTEEKAPPLAARILAVNAKHRFVVIGSGGLDGVVADMEFVIFDDQEREIGYAKAIEIRDEVSALSVLKLEHKERIKEGYIVVQEK